MRCDTRSDEVIKRRVGTRVLSYNLDILQIDKTLFSYNLRTFHE
jgi:hypothetical protein